MFSIAFIIFLKNFLEVILLIGIFLGVSSDLGLKKEKVILIAAAFGIGLSLLMPVLPSMLGAKVNEMLSGKSIDTVEAFLLIISAVFILSIMLFLRKFHFNIKKARLATNYKESPYMEFDFVLFFSIFIFLILREIEMSYSINMLASYSLFQDLMNLGATLIIALLVGALIAVSYKKFNILKVFEVNKYMLILFASSVSLSGVGMLMR